MKPQAWFSFRLERLEFDRFLLDWMSSFRFDERLVVVFFYRLLRGFLGLFLVSLFAIVFLSVPTFPFLFVGFRC